ncbi:MAG: phosphopentomutase [Limnochordia bacterium]|jgi:phosphopentomutase
MWKISRVIIIVLDSVGVGELPDSALYGDEGSNTLGNIARHVDLRLPHLERLGLGNIIPIRGVGPVENPIGGYGKMAPVSPGKDTTTGHWEIAGVVLDRPFPTYPDGFPDTVIEAFTAATGCEILGNTVASGTEIINELGAEHIKTGRPIVYTSADSVFQIAAHEEVIPVEELYKICEAARSILQGPHGVARVIARPFVGTPGRFVRTAKRRDFSLAPPGATILDLLHTAGHEVWAVGKISDVFAGRGISRSLHTRDNMDTVNVTLQLMAELDQSGLIFANCVDFDMLWGHRNDVAGYARGLEEFDARVPEILEAVEDDDLLILLADHGCDPTTPSTDHSREYVPLILFGTMCTPGRALGIRKTYSDVAATLARIFGVPNPGPGTGLL